MDRGTWVVRVGDTTYAWPHGDLVHGFGTVEYIRRLSGETQDASPARYVAVNRFVDYESFRRWCLTEHRQRGEFVNSYGFDPLTWDGYPTIRAVRELNMTTWLAQQLGQSAQIDEEVHKRIGDLGHDRRPRRWRTF